MESLVINDEILAGIVTLILTLVGGTGYLVKIKVKLGVVKRLTNAVFEALQDDKLTPDEVKHITTILKEFRV